MRTFKIPGAIRNKWLVVILLMIAYTFSFMDRYVVNLMVDPMKRDLHLSDTQVSMLLGISFALFYATLGIPLGRLADHRSRKGLIAGGIALWSTMTVCCGLARNYLQMFLSRMGVGVGEATLSPSAYSLMADYFPARLLATAISIYSLGIYLGSGIAYIAGGKLISLLSAHPTIHLPFLGDIFGWQLLFFLFGLPGLIVALIILFIREPARTRGLSETSQGFAGFIQWTKMEGKIFLLFCAGSALFNIAVYGTATWMPAFLTRVHGLKVDEAGLILGISTLILPSLGVITGGKLGDLMYGREGLEGRLKTILLFILLFIPANVLYTLTEDTTSTVVAMIPHGLLISASVGIGAACIQEIVPAEHRGIASAFFLFAQNLTGMGIGPLAVGMMNDYVFRNPLAVGNSMMIVSVVSLSASTIVFAKVLLLASGMKSGYKLQS